MGVNGETGELCDLKDGKYKIVDLYSVKENILTAAIN